MPGMPFNVAAAEVRAAILGVLGSWSGMVAAERSVTPPRRTVRALARFLGRHVDWLAAQDTATEVTEEIAQLARSARRAAYPDPVRRVEIGRCVEAACAGALVALVRPKNPALPAEISCDADPSHRWPETEWTQLGRRMPASTTPAQGWLSAADVSRLWSIPAGSVYRLASERRWRRRSRGNRTVYHQADVALTFDERARRG